MTTELDDVYRKFGEVSEAAQLLETELGNILLEKRGTECDLFSVKDPILACGILDVINRSTLGCLLRQLGSVIGAEEELESQLCDALAARNRLAHHFYREHNFRRNSPEGREIMIADLQELHDTIINAYKAVLMISGIDVDNIIIEPPTKHLPVYGDRSALTLNKMHITTAPSCTIPSNACAAHAPGLPPVPRRTRASRPTAQHPAYAVARAGVVCLQRDRLLSLIAAFLVHS